MLSASDITALHDHLVALWHQDNRAQDHVAQDRLAKDNRSQDDRATADAGNDAFLSRVTHQHRANFELWHIEDEARRPGATDAELADVKRRIDATNQRRNDAVEDLDQSLLESLAVRNLPNPEADLHSETPGLMIDRLSILSLKIYHTKEEACRENAPAGHIERNCDRLVILEAQRADLAHCFDVVWNQVLEGKRRFKLYRQMKMYNDPLLNPAIYGKGGN